MPMAAMGLGDLLATVMLPDKLSEGGPYRCHALAAAPAPPLQSPHRCPSGGV